MNNEPVKLDTLHEVREVARRLGLKPSTVRKMIFEKRIAVFRPSRRAVRIAERTVQEVLARGFTPAGATK
jgi:excisionase family DNA binding protein